MKLNFASERILAVVAHPDDAEILCAGTLARARAEGAAIGICVLCNGEKGQPAKPIRNLVMVRRKETATSAKLLGAELYMLGLPDGELADTLRNRVRLVEAFRRFRPTLVLAHARQDYHPDHQAASALAEAVSWSSASRGLKTASAPLPAAPALWWMDTINMSGFDPGFYVDISPYAELKGKLIRCHRSQLQRGDDVDFSPLADLMRVQQEARGLQAGVAAAEAFVAHQAFKRARAW
jgi:LmbE family N-acetylglucosaminyl deacetylase